MKKLAILLSLCLLTVAALNSQEIMLREAFDIKLEQFYFQQDDGSWVVFIGDNSSGNLDFFCHSFSASGEAIPNSSVLVHSGHNLQAVIKGNDGSFFIMWQVDQDYRLQKVSSSGQLLWPEAGISISSFDMLDPVIKIVSNDAGGVFVVIETLSGHQAIWAQHIDSNGNKLWTEEGLLLVDDTSRRDLRDVFADNQGGLLLSYNNHIGSYVYTYLLRISATGDQIGSLPLISSDLIPSREFKILPMDDGNFLIFTTLAGNGTFYLNLIDVSGQLLLDDWVFQQVLRSNYEVQMLPQNDGGLLLTYYDSTNARFHVKFFDALLQELYHHNLDAVGLFQNQIQPKIGSTTDGKTWLALDRGTQYGQSFLKVYTFDALGDLIWQEPMSLEIDSLLAPSPYLLMLPCPDQATFVWNGQEGGNRTIQTQSISIDGVLSAKDVLKECLYGLTQNIGIYRVGNKFLSMWIDSRNMYSIYFQLVDDEMQALLEPNGRAATFDGLMDISIAAAKVVSADKMAFIYGAKFDEGIGKSFLQTIDSEGNLGFADYGLEIQCSSVALASDDEAFYLAYVYSPSWDEHQIWVQKYIDNQPVWGSSGKLISSTSSNGTRICCYQGGYLVWHQAAPDRVNREIMVLKLDENGDPLGNWDPNGLACLSYLNHSYYPNFMTFGLMGDDLVAVVNSVQADNSGQYLFQKINPDGALLWGDDGITLAQDLSNCKLSNFIYRGSALLFLAENSGEYRIYQMNASGALHNPQGIVIPQLQGVHNTPVIRVFGNGSLLCVYSRIENSFDLFMFQMDRNGQPLGNQASIICNEAGIQMYPAVGISSLQALVSWNDGRYPIYNYSPTMGIWATKVHSQITPNDEHSIEAINKHQVHGNYPNPFNPSTTIVFSLASNTACKLDVYNLKGQRVRSLMDELLPAGKHQAIWDGKDDMGSMVSSGVYLYKLSTTKTSQMGKMLLMK